MKKFICKKCGHTIELKEKVCEGYINWKCTKCNSIMHSDGFTLPNIIWKCKTSTAKRRPV